MFRWRSWFPQLVALLMISTLTMILPLIPAALIWPNANGTVIFPACYLIGMALTWLLHRPSGLAPFARGAKRQKRPADSNHPL